MKKISLIVMTLIFLSVSKCFAQTDPAYDSIKVLNLEHFANLPVDSLLNAIPKSYNSIKLLGNTKNYRIYGLSISYPSGMNVWIKPLHYAYMNQVDSNRIWNLTLFKKETAHYISVIHPDFDSLFGQQ